MGYLSRDDFLSADDFATREVELEELGGTVLVRELNAFESDEFGFGTMDAKGGPDLRKARGLRVRVVTWATINEDGKPLFRKTDVQRLEKKSGRTVDCITSAILELSGIGVDEERLMMVECEHCDQSFQVDLVELEKEYDELKAKAKEAEGEPSLPNA